jgi:GNAT superfamily N-acetyltransferase
MDMMNSGIVVLPCAQAECARMLGRSARRGKALAMKVRPAETAELDHLARLWHEGWRDGHAHLAPPGLVAARTVERFRERLAAAFSDTFVIGERGAPDGFFILRGDELYQFFVARSARGSGLAATLIDAAEAELARRGFATAWLGCAAGNTRAARFYEKHGWRNARTQMMRLEMPEGAFEVEHWRFEKEVTKPQLPGPRGV